MPDEPTFEQPEVFNPEAERKRIRDEERQQANAHARATYDLSEARWSRFWVICWGLVAAVVVCALAWWAVSAIQSSNEWNTEQTLWVTQCRIEGGTAVRDIDLSDGPILCVVDSKVVRTR